MLKNVMVGIRKHFSLCLLLISCHGGYGIINSTVPLGNTTAPTGALTVYGQEPTDPGFNYVGQVNGSTGVYLGNNWVLTANHVGTGNFLLGGVTYNYDGTNSYQIGGVDLRLFRLSSSPGLTPLKLATSTPALNQDVVMIGAGRSPNSTTPTTWYVDKDPVDWVWQTAPFTGFDAIYDGWTTNSTKVVRWGTNVVEAIWSNQSYSSYGPMNMIMTDFDAYWGATPFESQAVFNDSGSGLFVENNGSWELAGTIVTVVNHKDQPNGSLSAIFGNMTAAIDLSHYESEINTYMQTPVPEPAAYGFITAVTILFWVSRRHGAVRSEIRDCRRFL
jgi:hypothetical protein